MAVAISGLCKCDEKKTSRVRQCSDLIAASNSRPLGSLSTNGSTTAKSGNRSRTISMQVFASRQVATTAKSLSADKMLFKPHRTTGWRSAITTLTQRDTEDSPFRTGAPNPQQRNARMLTLRRRVFPYIRRYTDVLFPPSWVAGSHVYP